MLTMDQAHRIRELYYGQGKNLKEIAEIVGCDWRTVRKYVDKEDFNLKPPAPAANITHTSKLDPYKDVIDGWLAADKKAPRKQRHTARRIYTRLCEEFPGFDASYRLTAQYVAKRKKELNSVRNDGYIPLIHSPGTAQADFGTADFYENGRLHSKGKYLVLSFPYSNGGYLQLNYGENLECLMEGLQNIFEYIGGVPEEIWFDNTRTIVREICSDGERITTERFTRFQEHYRFKAVFMNPASGNEKGNVENKVGYLRRNTLVPVPRFDDLAEGNQTLLKICDEDMQREHYEEAGMLISELFEKDKAALFPLPSIRFDTACYMEAHTNKYGKFTLNGGRHIYSASPGSCETTVQLRITSGEVVVMDENMCEICRHRRLYGDSPQESMDWLPYLKYIARRPRSLRNSGIYDMMPENMQNYLDRCANSDRGRVLKVLSELTDRGGFEAAVATVDQAIRFSASDPDSLKNLYRRLFSDVPVLPALHDDEIIPKTVSIPMNTNFASLDRALKSGGDSNAS